MSSENENRIRKVYRGSAKSLGTDGLSSIREGGNCPHKIVVQEGDQHDWASSDANTSNGQKRKEEVTQERLDHLNGTKRPRESSFLEERKKKISERILKKEEK